MKHLSLVALALCLSACGSSKQAEPPLAKLPAQIPPSHCRIIGTIVSIDPTRSTNPQDPCSKAPCKAKVKITRVLGYGSGFSATLAEGKEVEMTFAFTLAPTTKDLFPNLVARYKGLKEGDSFQADVQSSLKLGDDKPSLTVMAYEVQ
ncbi:MAG: hypothetical protein NZM06_06760 [Chloroherpetonaceae bacterium]|nr:hypothetical protein [Chloroherpetonaceae bacterium]MDW8437351.1 hypothetical protein [Chloroherpetonaceae bacterium]